MRTLSALLSIAPHYNGTKQEHKDTTTKRHPNTLGQLFLSRQESDGTDSALVWVHNTARLGAYRRITKRPDTLNRPYVGVAAEQFANNVASDIVIACSTLPPDKVARVTLRSAISRVDRGENKATKYWTCLYFVRLNFSVVAAPSPNPTETLTIPTDGNWINVTQTQYKQARKVESPEHAPYRWVECLEYRKTVRTLTDADHEDDGYTTKTGDMGVWSAMHSHLTPTEQTVLHLYGMGVKSHVIARAVLGNRVVKGDAAKVRILISRTLTKLSALTGQTEQEPNSRPIRRSILAPTR